jgi:signal transduction histidine kinase
LNKMPQDVNRVKEGVVSFRHGLGQILYAAKIHTFGNGSKLLVARDINDINKSYERLKLFSILIMVFMLMVILVSFFISLFVVSRINMIAGTAKNIMDTGDLSKRILIKGHWDDLSNLAQVLNALLDRIEILMQGIRSTSDNIAHDLRTPLTRLRNHLEELKDNKNNEGNIDALINEADHILGTFNSLLRITNIEKSARSKHFSKINLGEIVEDVIALYEPLAEEKLLTIKANICDSALIKGDRDMLFQTIANLFDNAIKFSPHHGHINIDVMQRKSKVHLVLSDNGCGISEGEKERVFDRFYRADYSRSEPGSGLGLSLVKAVLDLHKAEILLSDNAPGLRLDIKFNN